MHTLTNTADILGVGRVPDGPVVHLHLGLAVLRLPKSVHEDIGGTLGGGLCVSVQDRHAEDKAEALAARLLVLLQDGKLSVKFGLAVQVGRTRGGIRLVGGIAGLSREDVISGDVDEQDTSRGAEVRERLGGGDVQSSGTFGIAVNLVGVSLSSACAWMVSKVYISYANTTGKRLRRTVHNNLRPEMCVVSSRYFLVVGAGQPTWTRRGTSQPRRRCPGQP